MLRCALDGRRESIRVVLIACGTPPEVLEGRCFPRPVKTERVLSLLAAWRERFFVEPDRLVCCQEDLLPRGLIEALETAGYRLDWLRAADVAAVMAAWKQIRPDPRWNRGGLMASLAEAALDGAPTTPATSSTVAQHWLYIWLMEQVTDLRMWLASDSDCGLADKGIPDDIPF